MKKHLFIILLCVPSITHTAEKIADAYCNLGTAFYQANDHTQAINNYLHALEQCSGHLQASMQLGTLYFNKKQYSKACTYLTQCNKRSPKNEEVGIMLAHCYTALKHYALAINLYSQILSINSRRVDLFFYRAQCHKKEYNYPCAMKDVEQFLRSFPDDIPARTLKAQVLIELGNYTEAEVVLTNLPESHTTTVITAHLYKSIGKPHRAIELYTKARTIKPNNRSYLLGLSYSYLLAGDRRKGYQTMKEYVVTPANQQRFLDSVDKIPGKRIFIGAEVILDSMIQHIRYAKYIHELGGTTIVQPPESLANILRATEYIDQVVSIGEKNVPPYDYHIPAIVLPWLFDSYAPDTVPYLMANSTPSAFWQSHIPCTGKKKIGVYWHLAETLCSPTQQRIVPTNALNDLFSLDKYTFVALYPKHSIPNLTPLKASTQIITMCGAGFTETSDDMQSLLALMATLDIIITIDATVAHFAGALGKKTYLLLPFHSHWRWENDTSHSSWYPTITIIRQTEPGNWHDSIKLLLENL